MQLARCPICHSRINLEALVQDEEGRQLLALLGKLDSTAGAALITYLGLFRSANRDLANNRALRLAQEVLALGATASLTYAMSHTIESIHAKRITGQVKPLNNHNYLKRVLENTPAETGVSSLEVSPVKSAKETRRKITESIMNVNDMDW